MYVLLNYTLHVPGQCEVEGKEGRKEEGDYSTWDQKSKHDTHSKHQL